jgi:hypothetical protein
MNERYHGMRRKGDRNTETGLERPGIGCCSVCQGATKEMIDAGEYKVVAFITPYITVSTLLSRCSPQSMDMVHCAPPVSAWRGGDAMS